MQKPLSIRTQVLASVIFVCVLVSTGKLDAQIRSNSPEAKRWIVQGQIAFDRKDYDKVITCFTQAIGLDPKNDEIYYNRGLAYERKGDFGRAIADFTETIRLKPVKSPA